MFSLLLARSLLAFLLSLLFTINVGLCAIMFFNLPLVFSLTFLSLSLMFSLTFLSLSLMFSITFLRFSLIISLTFLIFPLIFSIPLLSLWFRFGVNSFYAFRRLPLFPYPISGAIPFFARTLWSITFFFTGLFTVILDNSTTPMKKGTLF